MASLQGEGGEQGIGPENTGLSSFHRAVAGIWAIMHSVNVTDDVL